MIVYYFIPRKQNAIQSYLKELSIYCEYSKIKSSSCRLIFIQSKYDGVLWKGLLPILAHSKGTKRKAAKILIEHFNLPENQHELVKIVNRDIHDMNTFESRWIQTRCKLCHSSPYSKIVVLLLPPQEIKTIEPEILFTSKLIALENSFLRLVSLNAFVATLGGGYFLCRHLQTAISLARTQRKIAYAMNDQVLAAKCTINEAYNYIYYGLISVALDLIKKVKVFAKHEDNQEMIGMCRAAKYLAKKMRKENLHMNSDNRTSKTHDDWLRIRIGANEKKIF